MKVQLRWSSGRGESFGAAARAGPSNCRRNQMPAWFLESLGAVDLTSRSGTLNRIPSPSMMNRVGFS